MANIIRSWSLKEAVEKPILKILEDNAITDDNLGDLTEDLIKELIPPVGLRIEFLKRWSAMFKPETVSDVIQPIPEIIESAQNIQSQEAPEEAGTLQRENAFIGKLSFDLRTRSLNIKEILNGNAQGKATLQSYKKTKYLTRRSRMLIVDIILTDLLNETTVLNNSDFHYISEEIVKLFPTEDRATYFIPAISKKTSKIGKSQISRGRLVDKYRNKVRALKSIHEWKPPTGYQHDEAGECSESEEVSEAILEAKNWLQSHSMPWEIVVSNWKLTSEYRRNSITSNKDMTLSKIFETWPILKQPNAHSLIEDDFTDLKLPTQELALENWLMLFDKLLAIRPPKKDDDNAAALLELISLEEITENAKIVTQLKLLPHMLPPKSRMRRKKSQWKPSIPEAKDSLIISTTLVADITKIQQDQRTSATERGTTLQPFIIAVGPSNTNITDLFISADDALYKVSSALKAIDLCFKIFHVFDIQYPIESAHIWLLLQRFLYGYECASDVITPGITEALSDLMALKEKNP